MRKTGLGVGIGVGEGRWEEGWEGELCWKVK